MTTKKFSGALGNVDEKYITEATSYSEKRSKRTWVRWVTSWYVDNITGNVVIQVLEEDLSAVTEWIADRNDQHSGFKVIVEKGNYITLD